MALNDLFYISSTRDNVKYQIKVQMVEIYNEQVRDLLAEDSSATKYPFFYDNYLFQLANEREQVLILLPEPPALYAVRLMLDCQFI
jgi:Kinesin motor domain